ncbi:NPC intracellular cholesterol transporter 2-like [Neocloeon triangulifer]|uniref:NPC intracellular cholesterol transporter 2-like n=1 Tax=Neocloeon triangulifer TaxID=2078957 RepID=UPI00286FA343|nr:NPC intracellular cholesterol transporter 2-like [Neocloeon triangulifer]
MVSSTILALALFPALVAATNFKECRSYWNTKVGTSPLNITLDGCDRYPCDFARGTNITGGMDFMYDKELSYLKPEVTIYWLGLPISWPMNQEDGCSTLTLNKCPVKANTRARYQYSLYLGPNTPLVSPTMRFEFRDRWGQTSICCELPIRIVANENEVRAENNNLLK